MTDKRLRRRYVLKNKFLFNEIFEKGVGLNSEHILLLAINSDSKKFGFAVSKKIRGAVKRNHAKRLLRELLRLNQNLLPEKKAIILIAQPGIEKTKFKHLLREFEQLILCLESKNIP